MRILGMSLAPTRKMCRSASIVAALVLLCVGVGGCAGRATAPPSRIAPSSGPAGRIVTPGTPTLSPAPTGSPSLRAYLPTLGPIPSRKPPYCQNDGPAASIQSFPSFPYLAWSADQVVVGRVVEQVVRSEVYDGQPQTITYSLIAVEQRVRGEAEVTLVMVNQGGTLYPGCTQSSSQITVQLGDRRLFFLGKGKIPRSFQVYGFLGSSEGAARIESDAQGQDWVILGTGKRSLAEVLGELWVVLGQPQPSDPSYQPYFVPLTQAPVAPTPTPRR
jgi:hypothetical protein